MLGCNPHQLNWSKDMELKLNKEEVEQVLLDYARTLLDATFNKVKVDDMIIIQGATFSYEEPEVAE